MPQGLLGKLKKLFSKAGKTPSKKPSFKKGATWRSVGNKYKKLPYFRIEDYETHQELWFYQKAPLDKNVSRYKLPLKLVQILFIAKFFPDDSEFFKQQLIIAFDKMVKYRRRV